MCRQSGRDILMVKKTCPSCYGSGWRHHVFQEHDEKCQTCKGKGWVEEKGIF
jgi:DnaJ-class molecular chaperone